MAPRRNRRLKIKPKQKLKANGNATPKPTSKPTPGPILTPEVPKTSPLSGKLLTGTRFRIGTQLGTGTYGDVRLAHDEVTKEEVAIKIVASSNRGHDLKKEHEIYTRLNTPPIIGIPKCQHYGLFENYHALVLERLGPSLQQLFELCGRRFSLQTSLMIGIQMLDRLEAIHSRGIIHRDIKPGNLMIAHPSIKVDDVIYMVDFGLATNYMDPVSKLHVRFRYQCGVLGTPRYMSLNAQLGRQQSRRDDLESLGNMLIYFVRGTLPWDLELYHYSRIALRKRILLNDLVEGCPSELRGYMTYVKNLGFRKQPDYNFLRSLFEKCLEIQCGAAVRCFDWADKIHGMAGLQ